MNYITMKTKEMATRAKAWGAAMLMTLILIMAQGITTGVNAQEGDQVDPEIQKKSQSDLQALTSFLATPAPMMMMAGASTQKAGTVSTTKVERPSWLEGKSKEEAMMEVLILKNQVFQGGEMPASRKQLNVTSFLANLQSVMTPEEFSRLANNEELLKQLDLFVEETPENQ